MYNDRLHTPKKVMLVGLLFSLAMTLPVFFLTTTNYVF